MLLGIAVAALIWPHPSLVGIVGYALSLGNIVDMTHFAIRPIGHLWSLSVEEHYYLLWPFFVLRLPRQKLPMVTVRDDCDCACGPLYIYVALVPSQEPRTPSIF